MQRSFYVHFLATLCSTFDDFKIACDSFSFLVIHVPCSFVANPCVSTPSPGVYPHDVFKPKVVPQCYINDFDCHGDEGPAFVTDVRFVATGSDLVIIRQIDVEDELFCTRPERSGLAQGLSISGVRRVHWTNFKAGRIKA